MKPQQLIRRFFPPMLATLAGAPPEDDGNWVYELKYDGFRAIAAICSGEVALWSRNQIDLSDRFPHVAEALAKLKVREAVVDGEIVAVDEKGVPRFQLLQGGAHRARIVLFDLLWLDGEDLRNRPWEERRGALEKILRNPPAGVSLAQRLKGDGEEALRRAAIEGYEGIIAKRRDSIYEMRRSKQWLKIKALNTQEFVIVGYQPSSASPNEIGSLHLAVRDDDGAFRYAGKVGTGFSSKLRKELWSELSRDAVPSPPVKDPPRARDATWVRPRLVAQVAFTEWTSDHRLRHPSFLGLRPDKAPEEVVRERPVHEPKPKRTRKAKAPEVILTNPGRLLYPRDGITKQDVADYYEAMAEPMLRSLRDRPLALEHWNEGIDKPSWFHQHLGREAPGWLTTVMTPTRGGERKAVRHLVVDSPAALRWLAQMSVLTIHMWASRAKQLEQPDWIVFDLDPAKGKGIEQAIDAANVMRGLLETLELPSVPKTSGKRGIHIFVPLAAGYTHEDAAEFACGIARAVAARVPWMTTERSLTRRRGRLYLDCMQNAYGKTVVAPYSLRAVDGAPVSAPLKWEEVGKDLDPGKFNLRTMPERLAKVGDLFEPVLRKGAKLPKLQ